MGHSSTRSSSSSPLALMPLRLAVSGRLSLQIRQFGRFDVLEDAGRYARHLAVQFLEPRRPHHWDSCPSCRTPSDRTKAPLLSPSRSLATFAHCAQAPAQKAMNSKVPSRIQECKAILKQDEFTCRIPFPPHLACSFPPHLIPIPPCTPTLHVLVRGVDPIPYKPRHSTSSLHSHSFFPRTHGFRSTTIPAVINNK